MLPAGASLWKDVRYGSYQGHYPPYPRVGRSWAKYGEKGALVLVLQELWSHLFSTGEPRSACPIADLYRYAAELEAAVAGDE